MLSSRSGHKFRGGMPPRGKIESDADGLCYAKALPEMPDYSNAATRATEKQVGAFVPDDDES